MHSSLAAIRRSATLLVIALGVAACGVEEQEAPPLIGPSGFAQSVTLSASPDRLPRDGRSQSVITVAVRNDAGQPVSGQRVTVGASAGTVSQSEVVTGSDGRATFTLTAPAAGTTGNTIDVFATPVGGDFTDARTRSLSIAVVGTSNSTVPSPSFTFTPSAPEIQQSVTFDATGTTDEGRACGTLCSYTWTFSDGSVRSGQIITRTFTTAGTYTVTLSVTDPAGASASVTRTVAVADVAAPTVSTPTVEPDPAVADQPAVFTASGSAAPGHRIVQYAWNFGDGTTQTTTEPSVVKTYTVPGSYTVIVTATDDLGRSGRSVVSITVVNPVPNDPVARFVVSPSQPRVGQAAFFDARSSTAGNRAVIETYRWRFGDGSVVETTTPTISHTYDEARTFAVTLTVTDNLGQTSTVGQQVTVVP